jgi:hypothetical protein
MHVKTNIKAGGTMLNHNETLARAAAQPPGLKVKTNVKAGGIEWNHNETLLRSA